MEFDDAYLLSSNTRTCIRTRTGAKNDVGGMATYRRRTGQVAVVVLPHNHDHKLHHDVVYYSVLAS